jgi:multidrug efflux pump subunit AcrA (membrane-fusion protein)
VPLTAVVRRRGVTVVFVVGTVGDRTAVSRRIVTVGRASGDELTISEGLHEGDRVVREGGEFLLDGQDVRVLE